MKNLLFTLGLSFLAFACGNPENDGTDSSAPPQSMIEDPDPGIATGKGIGEVKTVELTEPLNQDMLEMGESIYQMKCAACHKLTDQRVVGPGWAGITNRRKPEWIMNMITNVDIMLAEDPEAQKLLEECLTRMPNQNVSVGDARDILEFMRKNDAEKVGERDQAVEEG